MLSIFILFINKEFLSYIPQILNVFVEMIHEAGLINVILCMIYCIIIGFLGICATYSPIFLAMSLGHMSSKNKILASFGFYFGINFAFQSMMTILAYVASATHIFEIIYNRPEVQLMHIAFLTIIAFLLIYNAICFFGTTDVLEKKLNLE